MRVSHEGARGCGYRQPGGLYLVSDGVGTTCGLLPAPMETCPTCGAGIKPNRGWQWVDPDGLLPHHDDDELPAVHQLTRRSLRGHGGRHGACPLNKKGMLGEQAGLLWIGEQFYATPQDWMAEGRKMGFSRRVKTVPAGFQPGVTWVLAGHRKAVMNGYGITLDGEYTVESEAVIVARGMDPADFTQVWGPGVFHIWRPDRIEYVVKGNETEDELAALEKRGIEPVQVIPVEEGK